MIVDMETDRGRELGKRFDALGLSELFELQRLLGEGGMGVVFQAIQRSLNRPVALKVLVIAPGSPQDMRERFRREARLASQVRHPAVVEVFLHGETSACLYMASRLVEGPTLFEARQAKGPMALDEAIELFGEVLDGVTAIHEQGIVHRDLKPENILMEGGRPRITDLGLSRALGESAITQARVLQGTPLYMAPEVICGEALTMRIDLYALGMMILEAIAGAHPFADQGTSTLRAHVTRDPLAGPFDVEIPSSWIGFLRKSLDKDPSRRFASAVVMKQALLGLGGGAPRLPAKARGSERTVAMQGLKESPSRERTLVHGRPMPRRALFPRRAVIFSSTLVFATGVLMSLFASWNGGRNPEPLPPPPTGISPAAPEAPLDPTLEKLRASLQGSAPSLFLPGISGARDQAGLTREIVEGLVRESLTDRLESPCDLGLFLLRSSRSVRVDLALKRPPSGTRVLLGGVAATAGTEVEEDWTWYTLPADRLRLGINLVLIEPKGVVTGAGMTRLRVGRSEQKGSRYPPCGLGTPGTAEMAGVLSSVGVGSWALAKERIAAIETHDPEKRWVTTLTSYARIGYGVAQSRVTESAVPWVPIMADSAFDFDPKPAPNFVRALVSLQHQVQECPDDWLAWVFLGRGLYASGFHEAGWTALCHAGVLDGLGPVSSSLLFIALELRLAEGKADRGHARVTREVVARARERYPTEGVYFQEVWSQALKRLDASMAPPRH